MSTRTTFDEAYYERYYLDPRTRAMGAEDFRLLGSFVCSYVRYLGQPVRRVLDLGCGLGFWREVLHEYFPDASYTGVEYSSHLCARYGWTYGSVVDYTAATPFDLVICQDVLQYLTREKAIEAVQNLARLCRGAVYFAVLTKKDWCENCDRHRTDGEVYLRTGAWYRRQLEPHFVNAGGGVFIGRDSPAVLYELETLPTALRGR
jgi:SAM-dependent methyltransferase